MAIVQSLWAKFKRTAARPLTSGAVTKQEFYFDASAGLLAADIVDLGVLPANAKIHDAYIYCDAALVSGQGAAEAATVGILSGDIGSTGSRTLGTEIFNATSILTANTSIVRMTSAAAPLLAPAATDRSIGLQVSVDVPAGASKVIRLVVEYTL